MIRRYTLADLVDDMRGITRRTNDPSLIVAHLREPIRRFAEAPECRDPRFWEGNEEQGFEIYYLHEESDHRLAVVVASLLPGRELPPHNHRTWSLAVGIDGVETNVSWRRHDDGSRPGYAEIEETERRSVGPGEILTFLPENIHSVVNESDRISLSLNLYGLSFPFTHASRFDPLARTESPLIPDVPGG